MNKSVNVEALFKRQHDVILLYIYAKLAKLPLNSTYRQTCMHDMAFRMEVIEAKQYVLQEYFKKLGRNLAIGGSLLEKLQGLSHGLVHQTWKRTMWIYNLKIV